MEGKLTPAGMVQAKNRGYLFSRRLALNPGVYHVRIGVREKSTERIGTATTWVEVPELKPDRLEMSSLILRNPLQADPGDTDSIEVSGLEQIRMVQGVPVYETGDIFRYAFRVHPALKSFEGSELLMSREVLKDGQPIEAGHWLPVPAEERNIDGKGWFDLNGEIDIGGFDPGVYELQVRIKDARSNKSVQRTIAFGIQDSGVDQKDEALASYQRALRLLPNDADAAINEFREAIKLNPGEARYYFDLGRALAQKKSSKLH